MAAELSRQGRPHSGDHFKGHRGTGFAGPQVSPP